MSNYKKLYFVSPLELSETYHAVYELQHKLGIDEQLLFSTRKCSPSDVTDEKNLLKLLDSLNIARDHLITWYLKQTLVELNVTISLLTAKIKFIEYKLDLCNGLDLHQACSLSLVNFCNILSDMAVIKVCSNERKTIKQVSEEVGVPVWLSHYRNQICHVPSESPCISILMPLVAKSLEYIQESFWSKVMEYESFDEQRLKKYVNYIARLTYVTSLNKKLCLKKGLDLGKRRLVMAEKNLSKYSRICSALRRMIVQNPEQSIDLMARFITSTKFQDKSRNSALLLEQIIFAKQFERFVLKLVQLMNEHPRSSTRLSWLKQIIRLVSLRKKAKLTIILNQMELSASPHIRNLTDLPPIKCCQLAHRLIKADVPRARRLVISMRHKLLPILGKEKTKLMIKMTQLVESVKN